MKLFKRFITQISSSVLALFAALILFWLLAQLIYVEFNAVKNIEMTESAEQDIFYVAQNQQAQGQQADEAQQKSSHAAMEVQPIKVPDVPTIDSAFKVEFDQQDVQIHTEAVPSPNISVTDIDAMFAKEIGAGKDLIPIVKVQPIYPQVPKFRKIEGWVETEFVVKTDGKVGSVRILRAWPEGYFELTTLKAVKNWRFKPIKENGEAVSKTVRQLIEFKLQK